MLRINLENRTHPSIAKTRMPICMDLTKEKTCSRSDIFIAKNQWHTGVGILHTIIDPAYMYKHSTHGTVLAFKKLFCSEKLLEKFGFST